MFLLNKVLGQLKKYKLNVYQLRLSVGTVNGKITQLRNANST